MLDFGLSFNYKDSDIIIDFTSRLMHLNSIRNFKLTATNIGEIITSIYVYDIIG